MAEKTITKPQYYQLIGLKVLAERHNKALEEIIQAAADLLDARDGSGDADGFIADTIYSNSITVDALLKKLDITVFFEGTAKRSNRFGN